MKDFYHIWEWRPSTRCDQAHLYKFSFQCSRDLSHSICFQQFLREKYLTLKPSNLAEDQRMTVTFDTYVASIDHLVQCLYKL